MSPVLHPLLFGLALLALAARLSLTLAYDIVSRPFDVRYVPHGSATRVASLGHRLTLSDLYWIATMQYIGEPRAAERGWQKLHALADLVTDLDPRHGYAFHGAGIALSSANQLKDSNRLFQKGMDRGPYWWTFPFYISFNHWFYEGNYEEGARYAALAADRPGAAPSISHLALSLSSKAGRPEDILPLLQELRQTVRDEQTAERLDEQLKLAQLERDAQALERAVARYRETVQRPFQKLQDLVTAGIIESIPPDPFGGEYFWDPDKLRVYSSKNDFRFGFKEGPHQPQFHYQPSQKALEAMP
jgi:hypothetical protein